MSRLGHGRRRIGRLTGGLVTLGATLSMVVGWSSPALAITDATCTVDKPLTIKPRPPFLPARFETNAGGTVLCVGIIQDQLLAGFADITSSGVIFDTPCRPVRPDFTGAGSLTLTAQTLPFGSVTVTGGFTFSPAGGGAFAVIGSLSGSVLSGVIRFTPASPPTCQSNFGARVTGELVLADV